MRTCALGKGIGGDTLARDPFFITMMRLCARMVAMPSRKSNLSSRNVRVKPKRSVDGEHVPFCAHELNR